MIEKIENGRDLIILDAGDLVGRKTHRQNQVAKLMFKVFGKIGYTGFLPGEQELSLGLQEFINLSEENNIPIICGNLIDKNSKENIFSEFIIKPLKRRGLFKRRFKVGITGIIGNNFYNRLPPSEKEKISITSPEKALEKIIPILKEETDMIILLSHTSQDKSSEFKEMFPDIDIIITAHGRMLLRKEQFTPGKTLVLKEISKGKNLSWLQIFLDKKGKISKIEENTLNLRTDLPEDPGVAELIKNFEKKQFPEKKELPTFPSYITAQKCRNCHLKEFKQWVRTPHARAFDTLVSQGAENELDCLKCHVTGAGFHMGFGDLRSTPQLINVQCEACHGAGNVHSIMPEKNYGKIYPQTCTRCHNKEQDPNFNYEEKLKKVVHRP